MRAGFTRSNGVTKHVLAGALAVVAALGLLIAVPAARADQWSKTYSVSGKPSVHVTASDGNVQIQRGGSGSVEVRISSNRVNVSQDARISENQSGNNIEISVRPRMMGWFHWGMSGSDKLTVTVTVPSESDLNIETSDGNIQGSQISGQLQLTSADGNLSLDGMRGNMRFHTGDGNIDARNLDGSLDADTGDGTVTLHGRFDSLSARSGDGDILVEAAENSQAGSSGWNLKSGDGNIEVRVPSSFKANLEAHTGDGRISVNFPITISGSLSESNMSAKLNGGGPTLMVRTGDGSIRIEKQ